MKMNEKYMKIKKEIKYQNKMTKIFSKIKSILNNKNPVYFFGIK
jgi:hypothetical protein